MKELGGRGETGGKGLFQGIFVVSRCLWALLFCFLLAPISACTYSIFITLLEVVIITILILIIPDLLDQCHEGGGLCVRLGCRSSDGEVSLRLPLEGAGCYPELDPAGEKVFDELVNVSNHLLLPKPSARAYKILI